MLRNSGVKRRGKICKCIHLLHYHSSSSSPGFDPNFNGAKQFEGKKSFDLYEALTVVKELLVV